MAIRTIVVLDGDQTGQELLLESLRVLAPEVTRVPTEFAHFDLSLEKRRATNNAVVRVAVDDAYGAKEWREEKEGDEIAYRTARISRRTCRVVAEFSFQLAQKMGAKVFGGPKDTVSPVYEGMFKEELDAAHERHPQVRYEPQLIDATLALLLTSLGEPMVIPTLNRDGDLGSDLVLRLFGTIAGSESLVLGFDESASRVKVVMAEAPHGTAPGLQGKNVANPMAMILAAAALLGFIPDRDCRTASRAVYEAVFEA